MAIDICSMHLIIDLGHDVRRSDGCDPADCRVCRQNEEEGARRAEAQRMAGEEAAEEYRDQMEREEAWREEHCGRCGRRRERCYC